MFAIAIAVNKIKLNTAIDRLKIAHENAKVA